MQFAFRWMNCLLMREVPMQCTVRMWDTYLAEGSSDGFSEFHVYVCAAFLAKWSKQLSLFLIFSYSPWIDFSELGLGYYGVPAAIAYPSLARKGC